MRLIRWRANASEHEPSGLDKVLLEDRLARLTGGQPKPVEAPAQPTPETTPTPVISETPVTSAAPVSSAAPVTSAIPDSSPAPVSTQSPAETDSPVAVAPEPE